MSLFRGRSDVYARYWEKEGRSGYSPAYSFDWNEFMEHKRSGGTLRTFENKTLAPFTPDIVKKHLEGKGLIGVYPILPDKTSYFLAADFDGSTWFDEARAYVHEAAVAGLTAYLEKSKSGNGAHAWIFFAEPYPCHKSRRIGLEIVRRSRALSAFDKEPSFDRLFPNQDSVSADGFGNLIALPLQGSFARKGTMVFIDMKNGTPLADQWQLLKNIKRHNAPELDEALQLLELFDAQQPEYKETRGALIVHAGNKITLNREKLSSNTIRFLKDNLNFLNTDYLTRKRMGKSAYGIEKYFKLIEEIGNHILIPRGFLNRLTEFLDAEHIPHEVVYEYSDLKPQNFTSTITLSSAQKEIVETALAHNRGVIVAPPGSGKTMIGMEIVAKRNLPALILVHRTELLEQWVSQIQTYLNIPKQKIGRFHGVKKKIGTNITVGLMQSFARTEDKSIFKDLFGTVIVDECHHIPASTFRESVACLNPRFCYGLTATPKRKHNDEKLIYAFIGDVVATMEVSTAMDNDTHVPAHGNVSPEIIIRETELEIPFEWKTDRFQLLSKVISFDTERNRLIAKDVITEVEKGHRVLVLSERKEHLDILNLCLKGTCEVVQISGEDSSSQRFKKLKRIKKGSYQVILSTGQFFGEGMDIHNIGTLVLAFPFSFEGKLIQYIGRLLRGSGEKRVIDYRDRNVMFLERQYKQRQRYYKKMNPQFS